MQMSQFIESLLEDLRELALIGGEDLANAVDRLGGAVKQSARLHLIDALTQVSLAGLVGCAALATTFASRRISSRPARRSSMRKMMYAAANGEGRGRSAPL